MKQWIIYLQDGEMICEEDTYDLMLDPEYILAFIVAKTRQDALDYYKEIK